MIHTIFARKLVLTAHVEQATALNVGECTKCVSYRFFTPGMRLTGHHFHLRNHQSDKCNLMVTCISSASDDGKFAVIIVPSLLPPPYYGVRGWGWGGATPPVAAKQQLHQRKQFQPLVTVRINAV